LGCLHIDACVGATYVSDGFWLHRVLHQDADWILAHETFEIGDNPYLEGCVQNVLTSPDTPQFAKFETRGGRMSSIAVLTTHSAHLIPNKCARIRRQTTASAIPGSSIENSGIDVTRR
jgi:hypothetical protein